MRWKPIIHAMYILATIGFERLKLCFNCIFTTSKILPFGGHFRAISVAGGWKRAISSLAPSRSRHRVQNELSEWFPDKNTHRKKCFIPAYFDIKQYVQFHERLKRRHTKIGCLKNIKSWKVSKTNAHFEINAKRTCSRTSVLVPAPSLMSFRDTIEVRHSTEMLIFCVVPQLLSQVLHTMRPTILKNEKSCHFSGFCLAREEGLTDVWHVLKKNLYTLW